MIEISIIIPVRNQKRSLFAALSSLKMQIKKPRVFEIVICDDGSVDGTGDMLKRLRYPIFFKYFMNDPSLGRSANRNIGAQRSSGQILIFFDGDMVPAGGYIEAMLEGLSGKIVKLGDVKSPIEEKIGRMERYLYSRGRHVLGPGSTLAGRYFTSNNFSLSRSLFESVGGFDPEFTGWGGEDLDLGLRLEKQGAKIISEPKAITYHHHRRTIDSLADDFYDFGKTSLDYLVRKHPILLEQLPLRYIGLPDSSGKLGLLFRLLSLGAINRPALKLAEYLTTVAGFVPWPDIIFDYIFWGNLGLGYKHRKSDG